MSKIVSIPEPPCSRRGRPGESFEPKLLDRPHRKIDCDGRAAGCRPISRLVRRRDGRQAGLAGGLSGGNRTSKLTLSGAGDSRPARRWDFGRVIEYQRPRQVRIGARFGW